MIIREFKSQMTIRALSVFIILLALSVNTAALINCTSSEEHQQNLLYLEEEKKAESATILINNAKKLIPLKNLEKRKIAYLNFDSEYSIPFSDMLNRYASVTTFSITADSFSQGKTKDLHKKIKRFNTVIINTTEQALAGTALRKFIDNTCKNREVILRITGSRSGINNLKNIRAPLVFSESDTEVSAQFSAQIIFGGVPLTAKNLIGMSPDDVLTTDEITTPLRLKYSVPEDTGINCEDLAPIDEIMDEAIQGKMTPGAVVMAVKDGKVILEKTYGHHTYECQEPVCATDIYDLASITKAAATAIAVMRLYENKKINLDSKISSYLPETRKTDKKNITLRQLMLHKSGLAPSIDFGRKIKPGDYNRKKTGAYCVKAADNYYLKKNYYSRNMWNRVLKLPLRNRGEYVYSDLGMFFIKEIAERKSGEKFDRYLSRNFYSPLGMQTACFNPKEKFKAERIVPTEIDTFFRKTVLRGDVHDQAAALMGGVAGHAGLFSTANDLALLFQMLLNGGIYGGVRYFKQETVELFTAKESESNRRSLGFDGWDPASDYGFPSPLVSKKIFGHTGFTGTCVWADPGNNLIFIFLSNRTYPNTPNRLANNNIRSRILDVIYMAIGKG